MGIPSTSNGGTKMMNRSTAEKPNYSNWVSPKLVYCPGVISLLFFGLSFIFWPLIFVAVFFLLICAYFAYARNRFSTAGGNVQSQVQALVLAHLDWDGSGKALDIGCGNGPLTIALAQKYPQAQITGIDYWGGTVGLLEEPLRKECTDRRGCRAPGFSKGQRFGPAFRGRLLRCSRQQPGVP
jgi:hypothetical protein